MTAATVTTAAAPAPAPSVKVFAIDANPIAIDHSRGRFRNDDRVHVVGPLAIVPGMAAANLPIELRGAGGPVANKVGFHHRLSGGSVTSVSASAPCLAPYISPVILYPP